MEKNLKELLLRDICARLSDGVKVLYDNSLICQLAGLVKVNGRTCFIAFGVAMPLEVDGIKPYLRPMSSMTDEELKDLLAYSGIREHEIEICKYDGGAELEFWLSEVPCKCIGKVIDWLNKKIFDYRGLIPMGLAIEAKEGMYN